MDIHRDAQATTAEQGLFRLRALARYEQRGGKVLANIVEADRPLSQL
jgi:hypothetical protein